MGAYINPENITPEQAEAFEAAGFQCEGGFTYTTVNTTIMEANNGGADIPLSDGIDTYFGRATPTAEGIAALYEVAEAAEAGVGPEFLRGRGGVRVIANAFTAASLMGVDVVWG